MTRHNDHSSAQQRSQTAKVAGGAPLRRVDGCRSKRPRISCSCAWYEESRTTTAGFHQLNRARTRALDAMLPHLTTPARYYPHTIDDYSADGCISVWVTEDNTLSVMDEPKKHRRYVLKVPSGKTGVSCITCIAVSANGAAAASGGRDMVVALWDLAEGQCQASFSGHTDEVTCVAISADHGILVSGSKDRSVRVWDATVAEAGSLRPCHGDKVISTAVSANGRTALTGAFDGTVGMWDLATGQCRGIVQASKSPISCVTVSADGTTGLSGDIWEIHEWDLTTWQRRATLKGPGGSLAIAADGRIGLSLPGFEVRVWDLVHGQMIASVGERMSHVLFALSPDGWTAISRENAYPPLSVGVWDLSTGRCRIVHDDSPEARQMWEIARSAGALTTRCTSHFLEVGAKSADQIIVLSGPVHGGSLFIDRPTHSCGKRLRSGVSSPAEIAPIIY